MTTICGHERESLRNRLITSQLRDEDLDIDGVLECHLNILIGSVRDPAWLEAYAANCVAIDVDIHDSAKLAEMLAHEGRRLGFGGMVVLPGLSAAPNYPKAVVWLHCDLVAVEIGTFHSGPKRMPEARRLLLQWLQLPDGSREEAERALRGEA